MNKKMNKEASKSTSKVTSLSLSDSIKKFVKIHKIRRCKTGELVFYKAITSDFGSWWLAKRREEGKKVKEDMWTYNLGKEVFNKNCNRDPGEPCGQGLHIGTFKCAKHFINNQYSNGYNIANQIIRVLVRPEDIKCVPDGSCSNIYESFQKVRCNRLVVDKVVYKKKGT